MKNGKIYLVPGDKVQRIYLVPNDSYERMYMAVKVLNNHVVMRSSSLVQVGENSWKVLQEKLEKDRLRQDYNARLAMTDQQYTISIVRILLPSVIFVISIRF